MFSAQKQQLWEAYQKHETRFEIGFFIAGFIFDIVFISEVDDLFAIVQQIIYLGIIGYILFFEVLFNLQKWVPQGRMVAPWNYRSLILHFLLGSLLNLYSLFYIKSASLLNSLVFLGIMLGLVLANELPQVKRAHLSLKVALFAICVFSFFAILAPLALGYVGWLPVSLSVVLTLGTFIFLFQTLAKRIEDRSHAMREIFAPGCGVLILFIGFYALGWIPPVPISVVEQGIYHEIRKENGKYLLSTENPWWKFWNSGDQDFIARAGDQIVFFAQIYSPARFDDQVFVYWATKNHLGDWLNSDKIPLKIAGGRKEGFRGYAIKSNFQPGSWRIQIKTNHGQEISRIHFEVSTTESNEPREFQILER